MTPQFDLFVYFPKTLAQVLKAEKYHVLYLSNNILNTSISWRVRACISKNFDSFNLETLTVVILNCCYIIAFSKYINAYKYCCDS